MGMQAIRLGMAPSAARTIPAVIATAILAGCAALPPAPNEGAASPRPGPVHVLDSTLEPAGLDAPRFRLLGPITETADGGEPGIWALLDGSLVVNFVGCDRPGALTGPSPCVHGPLYRSVDSGGTWTRLTREEDGRLGEEGPEANGDSDVAADANGTIYATNLGRSQVLVHASSDDGATWTFRGNVVPEDHWADRQWITAGAPGHAIVAWMGGKTWSERHVAVTVTRDGGASWSDVQYVGNGIGWIGPVQMDPAGTRAFVPFTEGDDSALGDRRFSVNVARSLDGGATWDVLDTGAVVVAILTGDHFSGVLMAPALDVTGDGHVVVAWAEDVGDPAGTTSTGAVVKLVASADWGASWSAPVRVSTRTTSIMPWVAGAAGDRVAITYYASDVPLDSDYAGLWDVAVTVVDGVGSDAPQFVESVVERGVHEGGICAQGAACLGSDRSLLDYFENDVLPDGRLVVVYPANPASEGRASRLTAAIQDGGTPLLLRDGSP